MYRFFALPPDFTSKNNEKIIYLEIIVNTSFRCQ